MDTLVIGLDAASDRNKFGYAIATASEGRIGIESAGCLVTGKRGQVGGLEQIASALLALPDGDRALVAIDAPLGWPTALSRSLIDHKAGAHVPGQKDDLFRRLTDRRLRKRQRKHQPLEIGADRIARASVEALSVLDKLRQMTGLPLDLVWSPTFRGAGVIEVYPAATLRELGLQSTKYKDADQSDARRKIASALSPVLVGLDRYVDGTSDPFDACLCLLCALDFLDGPCEGPLPEELAVVKQEGWIWVRSAIEVDYGLAPQ